MIEAADLEAALIAELHPANNVKSGNYHRGITAALKVDRPSTRETIDRLIAASAAMAELASIAESVDRRPEFIRTARTAGASWPDIAEAAHLSRQTVINLAKIGAPDTP